MRLWQYMHQFLIHSTWQPKWGGWKVDLRSFQILQSNSTKHKSIKYWIGMADALCQIDDFCSKNPWWFKASIWVPWSPLCHCYCYQKFQFIRYNVYGSGFSTFHYIESYSVACFFWRRQRLWIQQKTDRFWQATYSVPRFLFTFCYWMRMGLLFVILEDDVWNLLYQSSQNSMKRKYLVISSAILPSLPWGKKKMHQSNILIPVNVSRISQKLVLTKPHTVENRGISMAPSVLRLISWKTHPQSI